jgi:hypothetical protein
MGRAVALIMTFLSASKAGDVCKVTMLGDGSQCYVSGIKCWLMPSMLPLMFIY